MSITRWQVCPQRAPVFLTRISRVTYINLLFHIIWDGRVLRWSLGACGSVAGGGGRQLTNAEHLVLRVDARDQPARLHLE